MDKSVYNNIIAGGIAGVSNVYLTYPLRTVVKIQYVEGLTITDSIKKLYKQNKLIRFYDGVKPTLFRVGFGRCLEAGSYSYFNNNSSKQFNNIIEVSTIATISKLLLTPLDTMSNSYQVNGKKLGKKYLIIKYNNQGIKSLYYGLVPNLLISFIGHYIWFSSFSYLNYNIKDEIINNNIKNGLIGFSSSIVSDIVINPIRIIKTIKQSEKKNTSYLEIIENTFYNKINKNIFRGMYLRTFINAFNSSIYVILWKKIESSL